MMRLRRAPALVVLSVLASAATAYAECAWVLWALGADAVAGGCDLASRVLYGAPVELIHFKAANLEGHEHDDHRHYARRNGYHSDRR